MSRIDTVAEAITYVSVGLALGVFLQGKAKATNFCQVTIGYPQMSPGNRCMWNKVQVGTTGDYLLCADIQVVCP